VNFYFIALLALIMNIYWIFLKNSEYTCKRIMNNSVGLDTPNSKYYALRTKFNVQHELGKTLVHTIPSTYHEWWTVYHWTQSYADTARFLGM